jgi:hypothetical protein
VHRGEVALDREQVVGLVLDPSRGVGVQGVARVDRDHGTRLDPSRVEVGNAVVEGGALAQAMVLM